MNSTAATKPTLQWGAEALWQQLDPILPGLAVEVLTSVASTNTALLERARVVHGREIDGGNVVIRRSQESAAFGRRAADVQPSLLVAEHQTGGRGRQGRGWQSGGGGSSLTFSLGLPLDVSDWSGLSLAVGVALSEAIRSALPPPAVDRARAADRPGDDIDACRRLPRVGIKWPNDLWLMDDDGALPTGRKLGGVLIETVSAGAKRLVVVGVGLNVRPFLLDDRVDGLANGFACMQELDSEATAPALLARLAVPLVRALRQFEADGFGAFTDRFARLDLLRGRAVRTLQKPPVEGTGAGVTANGALLLETRGGMVSISSGEVSVRFDAAALAPGAQGSAC